MPQSPKACVIGWPISQTLSPKLHNLWLKQYYIEGEYVAIPVPPDRLKDIRNWRDLGVSGGNVTIPHKETIMPFLDEIDVIAQDIGAVNTIVVREGKLYGSNTDAYGFIENLKTQADLKPYLDHAVVLGCGGAARAVVWALIHEGFKKVTIVARSPEKAVPLKKMGDAVEIVPWPEMAKALHSATLLVNTTPLGMEGKEDLQIPLQALSKEALVTDIVYNPVQTDFLQAAQARGNITIDGLGMLIFQAIPGFEAWFGTRPKVDRQRLEEIKKELMA